MTRASLHHKMNHRDLLGLFRSSDRRCSVKNGVLKNFANLTGKHLRRSHFLITFQVFRPATLLKIYSNTEIAGEHLCRSAISIKLQSNFFEITHCNEPSPLNLLHISDHLFLRTPPDGSLWKVSLSISINVLIKFLTPHACRLEIV